MVYIENREERKEDGKSIGRPAFGIYDNPNITKSAILIAIGQNSRNAILTSVNPANWDHSKYGYRKKLLYARLIKEHEKKIFPKTISYTFNWDILLQRIITLMKEDMIYNKEEINKGLNQINELNKIDKLQVKQIKRGYLTSEKINYKIKDKFFELAKIRRRIFSYKLLEKEFEIFYKSIEEFIKNIEECFSNMKQDTKNWLICQLIVYFEELLYSKPKLLSLNEELRNFLNIIAYTGKTYHECIINGYSYKPNEEIDSFRTYFIKAVSKYYTYTNTKIEWLILTKPEYNKQIEKAIEEYDKAMTLENEKYMEKYIEKLEKDEENNFFQNQYIFK